MQNVASFVEFKTKTTQLVHTGEALSVCLSSKAVGNAFKDFNLRTHVRILMPEDRPMCAPSMVVIRSLSVN